MSGTISIFLEHLRLPSPDGDGTSVSMPAPSTTPANMLSGWFEAVVLPGILVNRLSRQGLDKVAWIRWLCASITGADDTRVFHSPACRQEDMVSSEAALALPAMPMQSKKYFVRLLCAEGALLIPIHPKDAKAKRLSSRAPGDPTSWSGLDRSRVDMLALRDLNRCQLSGVPKELSQTHACHMIPRRRGDFIFNLIAKSRMSGDWDALSIKLDSLSNLVSLQNILHNSWDANAFCLFPIPNKAFDSQGRPLPYEGATFEADPAEAFVATHFALTGSAAVPATRERPIVRILLLPTTSSAPWLLTPYTTGHHRLRGPFGLIEECPWPMEWIWAYRCASQIATQYGTPALRQELQRFWDAFYVDPRGSSETGSSATVPSNSATDEDDDDNDSGAGQPTRPDVFDGSPNRTPGRSGRNAGANDADRTPIRRSARQARQGQRRCDDGQPGRTVAGELEYVVPIGQAGRPSGGKLEYVVPFGRPPRNFIAEEKCEAWRCDVATALAGAGADRVAEEEKENAAPSKGPRSQTKGADAPLRPRRKALRNAA